MAKIGCRKWAYACSYKSWRNVFVFGNEVVKKDINEAAKWYLFAANNGHPEGQYEIAKCFENGLGIEKNKRESVKWYLASAKQGYAAAQYSLSRCYKKGIGIEINKKEANYWLDLALHQRLFTELCQLSKTG